MILLSTDRNLRLELNQLLLIQKKEYVSMHRYCPEFRAPFVRPHLLSSCYQSSPGSHSVSSLRKPNSKVSHWSCFGSVHNVTTNKNRSHLFMVVRYVLQLLHTVSSLRQKNSCRIRDSNPAYPSTMDKSPKNQLN